MRWSLAHPYDMRHADSRIRRVFLCLWFVWVVLFWFGCCEKPARCNNNHSLWPRTSTRYLHTHTNTHTHITRQGLATSYGPKQNGRRTQTTSYRYTTVRTHIQHIYTNARASRGIAIADDERPICSMHTCGAVEMTTMEYENRFDAVDNDDNDDDGFRVHHTRDQTHIQYMPPLPLPCAPSKV